MDNLAFGDEETIGMVHDYKTPNTSRVDETSFIEHALQKQRQLYG